MHLLMNGWPLTACNREPWLLNMDTTGEPEKVTCKNCLDRIRRLRQSEPYAGEMIRLVEIQHWASLSLQYRYRYARRSPETSDLQSWRWYQFSRAQRRLLIAEMIQDGHTAWALGLPGTGSVSLPTEQVTDLLKTARKIAIGVQAGRQPVEHLGRVTEILNTLGQALAGGHQ